MTRTKVVCLGFQKTGTSSFGLALEKLGYRVASYMQFRDIVETNKIEENKMGAEIKERAHSLLDEYDAYKDTPWPTLYREMDEWIPNCKFILITRDDERWIKSVVDDFGKHENSIHEYIYGVGAPVGNEQVFLERYKKHNADVLEYFQDRPDDFIHLQLDKGEVNWENICSFLEHPVPPERWPHANTKSQKRRLMFGKKISYKLRKLFSLN